MLSFWKRKASPKIVDLDEGAFQRWIRAYRPPWEWFLSQPAEVQEALAKVGDDHNREVCIGIGWAIRDPDSAAQAVDAVNGDLDAEEALVAKIAAGAVAKLMQKDTSPQTQPAAASARPLAMSGFGQRVADKVLERQKKACTGKSFLGRKPDEVSA